MNPLDGIDDRPPSMWLKELSEEECKRIYAEIQQCKIRKALERKTKEELNA